MATHRTSICLDDAGWEALQQLPAYSRSRTISELLLERNPEAVQALHLKARLAILDEGTAWTRHLLLISRELKELGELEHAPNPVRAERAKALAMKACLIHEEVRCEAAKQTLNQAIQLYSGFAGKKVKVKDIELETKRELKSGNVPR